MHKVASLAIPLQSARHRRQSVSQGGNDAKGQKAVKQPISIWPEWNDQEIASEKWDISHKGKDKEKGKSPNLHAYEDPEGRVDLPAVIQAKVECWKRPVDFIEDKTPVIVDPDGSKEKDIDLISSSSDVISCSEIMRCIIAEITNLYKLKPNMDTIESRYVKDVKDVPQGDDGVWKPWQHIWPKEKSKNGVCPVYNTGGKYAVKVYWMGCWRKVTIDDWMPFNSDGELLLPSCKRSNELWPMLLAKALLKVASLDYHGGEASCEFGDFSVVQCLTGWIPEVIPLRGEHGDDLWAALGKILPHWKLENSITLEEAKEVSAQPAKKKDEKEKKSREKLERGVISSQNTSDRSSEQRENRIREKDSKEKFLSNAASNAMLKDAVIKEPEFAVFASYCNPPKKPLRVSVLREMADASEKLRQSGLSHNHPHSVMVTLRRDCPFVAPPPPVEIPRWRLIRQKKHKQPRDPRLTPITPPKEPQFLEITSPFVGYCVSPTPVARVDTPSFVKYRRDKDKMAEISEEGDELDDDDVVKKGGEEELGQVEEEKADEAEAPPVKDDTANNLTKQGSITARSDKSDDKKDVPKATKDAGVKPIKSERSSTTLSQDKDKDVKQNKTKKMSKDLTNEKKNDQSKNPAGRRMSKVDVKGLSEKELKKLAKAAEKEAKNEVKVEITDTSDVENDGLEDGAPATEQENEDGTPGTNKEKTFWIEYDDFWKCFRTLHIYHKPVTYMYSKSHLELKNVALTTHSKKSGIGLHNSSVAAQNSGKGQTNPPVPVGHHVLGGIPIDPPPPFLFVDSVNVIEIVVCLTSFSKWLDPPQPIFREKGRESGSNTELKVESATELNPVPPTPGLLVAEPYTWKSLVTGQPCLKIKSTGSKAAVLVLPPGRHLLRFLLQSPNGYHVGLCSQTPFTFGDEDQVMICLAKESCRFIEHTTSVVQNVGQVVTSFSELSTNNKHTILDLGVKEQHQDMQERHFQVFMICLLETLSTQLGDEYTRDMHFAWKAFEFISQVYLKERFSFRPRSSVDVARIGSVHKKRSDLSRCLSSSSHHRTATIDDNSAATRIQAVFRGYYVRKLNTAYRPDSTIHQQVHENLSKAWAIMENNLESFSLQLYRRMYKIDPSLFAMFPFYNDDWTRVTHNDYNSSFTEQAANTWFLLFREVFYVDEEILALPKMYSNIPTCFLRVINNDTFEEIPKVFQRVAPYKFTKNKHGYTFLAEARTTLSSLASGKFRLRLIGSTEPLPAPDGDSVNSQFVAKEIRDYYMPNKDHVLLRYSVHVTEDQLITVQLGTSKTDVLIKLQILDHEEEVACSYGRGHTVLPVYIVRRDRQAGEEENRQRKRGSRPPSKDSGKDGEAAPGRAGTAGGKNPKSKSKKGKDSSPAHSRPGSSIDKRAAQRSMNRSITQEEDMKPQVHKYIIQALVLRDSWPLNKESWDFVLSQRNAEKTDPLDYTQESSSRGEKSAGQSKGKKSKDGKESRSSKNQSGSRPASQQLNFDTTKAHWTLRIVTDASLADDVDIKKDTERQDEIRAMKAAWETAEPGRAAKAYKSRQKFLNEHLIKVKDPDIEEADQGEEQPEAIDIASSSVSALATDQEEELFREPPPRQPSRVLKPFDITPYMRCGGNRIVLDEAEENKRRQQKQEIFRQHKQWRDEVEKRRDMDRQQRNIAKEKQIQMCEEWQAALDKVREDINTAREAYRQTFIVQEPPEEEAIEAVKERSPTPAKGRKASKSPKGARKSPKAKKK
ncbi:androglobin-like isoform X2 [Dendronephthya gigantea]|uniref:androglobin-like isoform X2 n=1 Tax=Dendronephthya gigantea TaxID=151771 RepID=UPI00106D18B0|nr:androglobin-like isoform X2 [Dendronephthya gigantea]